MERVLRPRHIFEIGKHIVGLVAIDVIRLAQWRSRAYKGSHHQRMNEPCFLDALFIEEADSLVIRYRMLARAKHAATLCMSSGSFSTDAPQVRGCIVGKLRDAAPFFAIERSEEGRNWMGIAQTACTDSRSLVRSVPAPQTPWQFARLAFLSRVHNFHVTGDANARFSEFEFAAVTKVSDVLTHALRGV